MPVYSFKGYDAKGNALSGIRDADSSRVIKQLLRREGVFVTDLKETQARRKTLSKPTFDLKFITHRVSPMQLAVATRQLSTLIGAGIPLVDALVALIDQVEEQAFKSVWADVKQHVNEGMSFADALALHSRVFTGLYINMVRAGESSGALDVVLNRLADFTESQAELRAKLVGTMVYPAVMLLVALGVVGILFTVVIPQISKIFEAQHVVLPIPTRILIFLSNTARQFWFLLLPTFIAGVYGFVRYIKSERGRPWWDKFVLNAPLFGKLVRMVAVARFTKTLATLLGSSVPLLTAFDIVKNVVQNSVLVKVIETTKDCVKEGESIAAPLARSKQFPPLVTHMIAIGEKSGQLESMLNNIAKSYDTQVDGSIRALTSVFEPLMIVVMGIIVAFIVFSILLPMLQISSFAG